MKRITRFIVFNIIIILIAFYSIHTIYINKLSIETDDSRKLSELEKRIYWIRTDKASHYKFHPKKKESGKIRIGCFGDSFTYGDEVNFRFDYPSQLQDLLDENHDNYEVINFGMGYQGFHQSFMIWQYLGNEYNLDYVVLGPQGFQYERDSTFNHTFSFNYLTGKPEYVHSRYILDGDDVKLIDVQGHDINEKVKDYWSFIPRYSYLRYDSELPVFLRAVIALFRPNMKFPVNPFYYKDDIAEEMDNIHTKLLTTISSKTANTIVGHYSKHVVDLTNMINKNNLKGSYLYHQNNFPYVAYSEHNSPLGNNLLARQVYHLITDKETAELEVIVPINFFVTSDSNIVIKNKKLSDYDDITFSINDKHIGNFFDTSVIEWEEYCYDADCNSNINVFEHVTSLIGFSNNNFTDSVFIPIKSPLHENSNLYMVVENEFESRKIKIGDVNSIYPGLNIGMINLGRYKFERWIPSRVGMLVFPDLLQNITEKNNYDIINIQVENETILSAKQNENGIYEWIPVNRGFFIIRANGKKILDVSELGHTETIFMDLSEKSTKLKIPVGKVIKINKVFNFNS